MKGFLIAGTNSGIGKTTISMALMSAFENVSPFKVGPDYIDPKFHEVVTGNKSYNLDLFMMGEDFVKYSFYKHHKDFSIIEGVMGLYDGIDNSLENNSSAHVARVLDIPVILIVDGIGKSTSIAAQILGYRMLDKRVNLKGVIINKVSGEKTYNIFKEAIEKYTDVKCLGYVKKNEKLDISSRHLGLLQADEVIDLKEKIDILKNEVLENIDLEEIEKIAKFSIDSSYINNFKIEDKFLTLKNKFKNKKIGRAKDLAFSFYYNDNIKLLKKLGFEIIDFSPIKDKKIPECDILYFGGGYPENFLQELSSNKDMISSIKKHYKDNKFIFAECGGFMYLSKSIENKEGEVFKMCDIVPCSTVMTNRLNISRFGYIYIKDTDGNVIGRGHEFHYSKIKEVFEDTRIMKAFKKDGRNWETIFKNKNCFAGYPHVHLFGLNLDKI